MIAQKTSQNFDKIPALFSSAIFQIIAVFWIFRKFNRLGWRTKPETTLPNDFHRKNLKEDVLKQKFQWIILE